MKLNLEMTGVDPHQCQELFADLQGNILKGHGRDHTIHLFIQFDAKQQMAARKWLASFATNRVTSAGKQFEESRRFKESGETVPGDVFATVLLSASGYPALGIPVQQIPPDERFINGMQHSRGLLNDPPKDSWEEGYRHDIHAMILLADDVDKKAPPPGLNRLINMADEIKQSIAHFITFAFIQRGDAIRNDHGDTIEHFGYVDGRSQPLFLKEDIAREARQDGITEWDPSAPLKLALVQERSPDQTEHFGSYFVFRKLEQNVHDFKEREKNLAKALDLQGDEAERAGALVVGRFEDGTPVTLQYAEGMHNPVPNNFTFEADPAGLKCPFHAHVRRINPRGSSSEPADEERMHRVVRRGITYDDRPDKSEEHPREKVGLLFMCFQRAIANQFEYLQSRFANDPNFPNPSDGVDPVIGQPTPKSPPVLQQWPPSWGDAKKPRQPFDFSGFVSLKGGEYFFAPSIHFLKGL